MKRTALLLALALAAPHRRRTLLPSRCCKRPSTSTVATARQVTSAAGVGKTDTGNVVIRAHCSSGEPWILIMEPDPPHRFRNVLPCHALGGAVSCK